MPVAASQAYCPANAILKKTTSTTVSGLVCGSTRCFSDNTRSPSWHCSLGIQVARLVSESTPDCRQFPGWFHARCYCEVLKSPRRLSNLWSTATQIGSLVLRRPRDAILPCCSRRCSDTQSRYGPASSNARCRCEVFKLVPCSTQVCSRVSGSMPDCRQFLGWIPLTLRFRSPKLVP